MNASSCPNAVVERDVVLHWLEVRQAESDHLLALPVLLEPAAAIASHIQGDDEQTRDGSLADCQRSHRLLALARVLALGLRLLGLPPPLVGLVPLDGGG